MAWTPKGPGHLRRQTFLIPTKPMKKFSPFPSRLAILVVAGLLSAAVPAPAAVTMQLDRAQIGVDEAAQLTVQSTGGESAAPSVPGLDFTPIGQSSQIQIINGSMTSRSAVTYQVTAQAPGTYTIPVPGSPGKSIRLQVGAGTPGSAPAGTPNVLTAAPNLAAPVVNALPGNMPNMMANGNAFVRMQLPKKELYVGETVPVEIQVGLRSGLSATLNGLPSLNADAFTLNKLTTKPDQTQEELNGEAFTILTWHSLLTVIKPGNFSLAVETPVTVRMRSRPQMPAGLDDDAGFSSAFIQNFFGSVTQKDITLTNTPDQIHALELPATGKPANFSGAVGKFALTGEISATTATVGDALNLRLKITGSGAFDRVKTDGLATSADWKTYHPTAKFTPEDAVGYAGEKVFEQAVVPLTAGSAGVPAVGFSFFNPETKQYETVTTPPMPVEVAPAAAVVAKPAAPAAMEPPQSDTPQINLGEKLAGTGWATLSVLRQLVSQPKFLMGEALLLIAFVTSWLWLRLRAKQCADTRRIRQRARNIHVSAALKVMSSAMARGDTTAFFLAARSALQHSLSLRWNVEPETITSHEIATRLRQEGEPIRQVFEMADEIAYSGYQPEPGDFRTWEATVRRFVKEMA